MPVMKKRKYATICEELDCRWKQLLWVLESRPLHSDREGCKGRTRWVDPGLMCATTGDASDVRLAIDDFMTILKEIRSTVK